MGSEAKCLEEGVFTQAQNSSFYIKIEADALSQVALIAIEEKFILVLFFW